MRPLLLTTVALACLVAPTSALAAPAADDAGRAHQTGDASRADQPKCPTSARSVATTKLRTPRGAYYGTAVIKVSTRQQGDYSYVVCAYTDVAKKHRSHRTVVRQAFAHHGEDGDHLGQVRGDTYADKRLPLIFGSSFVPAGNTYVFTTKVKGAHVSGKVRFRVPS